VISAVGHEIDYSIADFVADLRAATPSAGAELVARSRLELEGHLDHLVLRLAGQMRNRLDLCHERVDGLLRRLRSPQQALTMHRQRREELERRLQLAMRRRLQDGKPTAGRAVRSPEQLVAAADVGARLCHRA